MKSDQRLQTVEDFIGFLRLRNEDEHFNGLLLSETTLARNWDTAEEDKVWASL
jgi:hypothetical protein